jgi:spore coat protein U-like protein
MRRRLLNLFFLGLSLQVARAQYSLQIGNVTWSGSPGGYSCFSSTEYPNTVNFTITKTAPGNRAYAVTAGPSSTTGDYARQLASGADRLNYQLYTTSTRNFVLKAPPAATLNEVIHGSSKDSVGTVIPLAFTLFIPPGQLVLPGSYSDTVSIRIYHNYDDNGAPMDSRTITLTAFVIPAAILSLVPTGSSFSGGTSHNLNFGTLSLGQMLGCDLLIRKNTSCSVTLNSVNNGVMKLIPTPTADEVTYSCTVNGNLLNFATPAQFSLPPGVSPAPDGNRLPINVTIGDPSGAAAGDYQDQIIITLVAL